MNSINVNGCSVCQPEKDGINGLLEAQVKTRDALINELKEGGKQ